MNFFRAISTAEEFSDRALNLTTHAIRLNPHNYNLWCYRRKILRNLKYDPQKEFCWCEQMVRENPKNFYAWEHRRSIGNSNLSYCDAETELELTENLLRIDPKNYNIWQHRQWAIQTFKFTNFGLLTSEMKFTEEFLIEDLRNNSAWNQRFFILKQRGKVDFTLVKREFNYAIEKIKIVVDNESAWNYLRGILNNFPKVKKIQQFEDFLNFLEKQFYDEKNFNRHLVGFLIDMKIEIVLQNCDSSEMIQTQKIFEMCNLMAEKFDKMRKNYWKFVYKNFYFEKIKKRHEQELKDEAGGSKVDQSWKSKIGKKMSDEGKSEETFLATSEQNSTKKKNKKKVQLKKSENCEKASHRIGTDLLFDLMSKYNR
jgi:protein farnesyltransferase/geranylgeranyltransferase type-1 subunit alpha